MAARKDVPPPAPDFESAEYDNQFGDWPRLDVLQSALEYVLSQVDQQVHLCHSRKHALEQAVDSAMEAALTAVDMSYLARDDRAVSAVSLAHASWEPELAPIPCAVDTWVRAAVPESQQAKQSYALTEFLRTVTNPPKQMPRQSQTGQAGPDAHSRTPSPRSARHSPAPRSAHSQASPRATKPAMPPAEARLREELSIRKTQLALAADLAAADAAAQAQLESLAGSLKGREYVYDHKGRLLPAAPLAVEKLPALSTGPGFAIKGPGSSTAGAAGKSKGGKSPPRKPGAKSGGSGSAAAAGAGGAQERKLVSDFRETAPRTQPSALETMAPAGGVTLRQGAQSKLGPRKGLQSQAAGAVPNTKEELLRYAARQQQALPSLQPGFGSKPVLPSLKAEPAGGQAAATSVGGAEDEALEEGGRDAAQPTAPAAVNLFSGMPDIRMSELGMRRKPETPPPDKPPTPDVNPMLVGAADWGRSTGQGSRGSNPALTQAKPDSRAVELEMGRSVRLPRERASQATGAPPLSPAKVPPHVPQPMMTFG